MHAARVRIGSFIVAFSLLGIGCAVDGTAGAPGASGHNSLVNVSAEPPGANCGAGGQRIDAGVDANANGVLDPSEITDTSFVCSPLQPPAGVGILQNISLTALRSMGWRVCYQDSYATTGVSVASILSGCQGTYMMLACKADAVTDTIALAAADTRAVVTQVDPAGATTHHDSNGVGWYFSDSQSWGFYPQGDTLNRNSCDTASTNPDRRLCWHTGFCGAGQLCTGYRCGNNSLNGNVTWQRLILVF